MCGSGHFAYRDRELHAEEVPLARIAADVGTPFYCYATAELRERYGAFAEAFAGMDAGIFYSVKANSNLAVIRTFGELGAGADVVSEGELRRALAAGIDGGRIVYSGVGKTTRELLAGLDAAILQFNVESEGELRQLSELAAARGAVARVALRLNPDVDAATHDKIATGKAENKFGISWPEAREVYRTAADLPGIEVTGIAVHIGSQLTDLAPLEAAFGVLADAVRTLRADGHAVRRLDLGGGLGIAYRDETPPSPDAYAAMIRRVLGPLDATLILEPGRHLVGNAGVLVARVVLVKQMGARRIVVVDGAMNDLIRPSFYEAWHTIVPIREPAAGDAEAPADVVGPVCESADVFAAGRPLTAVNTDDLLAFYSAGAYGAVMASTYNSRRLVPEVLVCGSEYALVRARPSYDDMLALETIPEWLAMPAVAGGVS